MNQGNMVTVNEAKTLLHAVIGNAFHNNIRAQNVHITGSPGGGKSSIVFQVAEDLSKELGKPVEVIDVRLTAVEASEVQGIPHNAETGRMVKRIIDGEEVTVPEKSMVHSTPDWFPIDEDKFYILFLDELPNCNVAVQQAAYRLLLDKSIQNGRTLPVSCAIVSAGNLKSDKTGARPLIPAAANRIGLHLTIDQNRMVEGFLEYAIEKQWHRSIVGYLSWRKQNVYVNDGIEEAFATPRSWGFVNEHLNNPMIPEEMLDTVISGAIGTATAMDFAGFREFDGRLPDFNKIRQGKESYEIPAGEEGLKFAIANSLGFEIVGAMQDDDEEGCKNLMALFDQLPKELHVVTFRVITNTPDARRKVFAWDDVKLRFNQVSDKMRSIKKMEKGV